MRAPVYSCVRLGAHAVEPHRNHHASCSDVPGNGITESRTYSNDNLLTAINYSNASLGNLTYTWDTNKNKKSESIGGVMSGYGFTNAGTTYDDEDRLTGYQRTNGALSQSWNLTSVGDWNSVTTSGIGFQPVVQNRTHGPTHELLTAGGQTVNTDVKGNITLLPAALSSLASTALGMSWDFDNKLKSVDVGNNSSTDVEYKYDALGRRVARVGSSGSFVYVQSDQQTIADYGVGDAPSSPLYRYVYASYIDEPVVRKGAGTGGTIHYFHRNQQYSVTAVTTSAGATAERYAYSAYGEPIILNGSGAAIGSSSINNRYSYTGREWDATVGLHHFRARWMSPKTGRFLTRDPIKYAGSEWNLSEYVRSNPGNSIDPFGLSSLPPIPDSGLRDCQTVSASTRLVLDNLLPFKGGLWTVRGSVGFDIHTTARSCLKTCNCGEEKRYEDLNLVGTFNGRVTATLGLDEVVDFGPGFGTNIRRIKVWGGIRFELHATVYLNGNYYKDDCTGLQNGRLCVGLEFRGNVRGGLEAKYQYGNSEWDLAAVEIVGSCYGNYKRCYENWEGRMVEDGAMGSSINCEAFYRVCALGFCYRRQLGSLF
jgi:RHS repeat-associated protein